LGGAPAAAPRGDVCPALAEPQGLLTHGSRVPGCSGRCPAAGVATAPPGACR
jgi:hypothetical protein